MTLPSPRRVGKRSVVVLLLTGITINYVDRQTLSLLAPALRQDLGISSLEYSYIVNSFLVVYSVMYSISGGIVDRLGTRRGLGIAVIWWSIAEMLHAFANGTIAFCICRALLAVGEAAIIPGAVKAIAEWFSSRERSVAISIVEMGLSLGPMIAPPIVVRIALHQGWRYAFVWTSVAGLLWSAPWWYFYRSPLASKSELAAKARKTFPLSKLLHSRDLWGVGAGRFFGDPVWYFYLFWLPKYFNESKGLSLESIGTFAWIPYVASLIGGLVGGFASRQLVRRNRSPVIARLIVMAVSGALVSTGVLCIYTSQLFWTLLVISVASGAMLCWGVNLDTLPTDLFDSGQVAQVMGICGLMGSSGGILFTALTGYLVQNGSYTYVWIVSAFMYPAGFLIMSLLLNVRKHKRLHTEERAILSYADESSP